jgi:CRISPR-associated protein Cas1
MTSRILPSQRHGFHFLEHCRVFMDGERVVYAVAEGATTRLWAIPTVNTSAILLGVGTSVTQAAMRRFAEERVLVAFVGTGGTPIFMGSTSEYAPTEHLQRWMRFWSDPDARLEVAKYFALERCNSIARLWPLGPLKAKEPDACDRFRSTIPSATDIEVLRGHEGDFAKSIYKVAARTVGIEWQGRKPRSGDEQDLANRYLDQGNYLAYGLAGVVLWTLGVPPGLAVNHGATRAGGLVFDLADIIKDAVVLPQAFANASKGRRMMEFRTAVVDDIHTHGMLARLFEVFQEGCLIGEGVAS